MSSLRRQLLTWLLLLYVLSAAVTLWVSYRQYESSVSAFMDGQMHTLAFTYTRQTPTPADVRPVNEQQVEHNGSLIVQLWGNNGRLLFSSLPIPTLALQPRGGFATVEVDGHGWRVYTALSAPTRVQVVQSNTFRQRVILDSAWKSVEPIALMTPISAALLWLVVMLALRPVDRLVQAIARQDGHSLAELPLTKVPRELLPLITSMNGLLARLREAFASQQRFVQDAAHELRTPLTALKLQVHSLRQKLGSTADEDVSRLQIGIERMQRLVEQLLKLARQEALRSEGALAAVDLQEILKQSIRDLVPLAEHRNVDLGLKSAKEAKVLADANDLRSVFDNLLDNALRYTPQGGSVDVTLRRVDQTAIVEFADTGPGIPPALLERVFDRFFRVLGTGTEGSGLGLAIAMSAAGRSGLNIELMNRLDQTGLVARVSIPNTT